MKACIIKYNRTSVDIDDYSSKELIKVIDQSDWSEVTPEEFELLRQWCFTHGIYPDGYILIQLEDNLPLKISQALEEQRQIEKKQEKQRAEYAKKEKERKAKAEARKIEKARKLLKEAGEI